MIRDMLIFQYIMSLRNPTPQNRELRVLRIRIVVFESQANKHNRVFHTVTYIVLSYHHKVIMLWYHYVIPFELLCATSAL